MKNRNDDVILQLKNRSTNFKRIKKKYETLTEFNNEEIGICLRIDKKEKYKIDNQYSYCT